VGFAKITLHPARADYQVAVLRWEGSLRFGTAVYRTADVYSNERFDGVTQEHVPDLRDGQDVLEKGNIKTSNLRRFAGKWKLLNRWSTGALRMI